MGLFTDVILTGTTNGSGALTVNSETQVNGLLYAIEWVFGSGTSGVDFVLSLQSTPTGVAETIYTATNADANATYYPRVAEVGVTGSALGTYALIKLLGKPRLVVSSGGDTKPYTLVLYFLNK